MSMYLDIAHTLEQEISNQYSGGDYLPSEKMLAERFEVNRHTVRRAVDELIMIGKVHRQQGKGCMVLAQPMSYPIHAKAAFTRNLLDQGSQPRSEVLKAHLITANSDLAQQLNVELDSRIIHIRTLRKVNGRPMAVIEQYLANLNWWPVLQNFKSGSLHQFLRDHLGVNLTRSKTRISANPPNNQSCRLLQMTPSLPLLTVKTLNVISGTETVAEYSCSSTRSDLMELVVDH
ncbi:phosphonate metabolism transcriptional regulator PhnF [Vibrio rumoiensis]|uniref:phosphonate metabolism transcriptional regulator PhnF n=1 Tax=Vibrio rumoiensis TaxID=76258 RepID=UPI000B5C3C26|nr:phosphonate metabolism transcriptional regulator PhnF [Vibrio rumoiensis]